MEISTAAPVSLSLHTNATKSPDADRILPAKSPPYTNGVLKRHAPPHIHHSPAVVYKECMKNHAAAMGRHALDGCGEFMPSPAAVAADPTSLKCAACGCHRNFHRRESPVIEFHPYHRHHPPPPPIETLINGAPHSRKRFRTKFSEFQKEKMRELAEKLGWKMQKSGEGLVAEFCSEVGVEREVFKVWMHNNKNTFQKRQLNGIVHSSTPTTTTTNVDDNGSSGNNDAVNGGNNDAVNGGADGSSNSS